MKKALIMGAGGMGVAIAYAMGKFGFDVMLDDVDGKKIESANDKLKKLGIESSEIIIDSIKQSDVVISAAPYSQNIKIATVCAVQGFRYCDLGGNAAVSRSIHEIFQKHNNASCFTDLGLAPGYANMLAESLYKKKHTDKMHIRVGGLPVNPVGRLRYSVVFSIVGFDNCYLKSTEISDNL